MTTSKDVGNIWKTESWKMKVIKKETKNGWTKRVIEQIFSAHKKKSDNKKDMQINTKNHKPNIDKKYILDY